jgi:hypothetical protein
MTEVAERNGRGGSMKKNPCERRRVRSRVRSVANGMHWREHNKI